MLPSPKKMIQFFTLRKATLSAVTVSAASLLVAASCLAQDVTQPIYRVANEASSTAQQQPAQPIQQLAQQPAMPQVDRAVQPAAAMQGVAGSPFDLTQRPGEHPLMPCLRLAKQGLVEMDTNVRGYTATVTKLERIDGKLSEEQKMFVKIRHQPFSAYMKFIEPYAGREVLYNAARNNGKLVALDSGWKRRFGKVKLDPNGRLAMAGQRYPITMLGIRNLTAELVKIAEQDVKYGECEVRYDTTKKVDGRPTTMIEAIHPVPRKNFRFNIAQIYVDNEWRIPVAYTAYSWPTQEGGKPVLEEQYVYNNVQLNPGLTETDFDETNPNLFR